MSGKAKDAVYVGEAIKRALALGPPGETWGPQPVAPKPNPLLTPPIHYTLEELEEAP